MEPPHEERRLTAILSADVVGYSRLMAADESGTLAQLKTHRKELLDPKTAEYHGRVVKLIGDGALMEFGSVVDAVLFAVDVQRAMAERNAAVPEDRRITYRVGINIGDIIVEGDDIYGDGVNIASRLEKLADPGGICIARNVFNQVRSKVDFAFEDLGDHKIKNIPEPVRVYSVQTELGAHPRLSVARKWKWQQPAIFALVAIAVVSGTIATWTLYLRPSTPPAEVATGETSQTEVPDAPSIAVLPFDNMSDDPDLDYFSAGISEDIITELARFPDLLVIARNSSFTYKGKPVKVEQVAKELGVRYVLEGSVRRSGDTVRITAQLVDANMGHHVWADRYDNEGTDVFTLQDEVTTKIIASIAGERGQIRKADYKHAWGREAVSLTEYDFFLRIHNLIYQLSKDDIARARKVAEEGLKHIPDSALIKIKLGWTLWHQGVWAGSDTPEEDLKRAFELAQEGLAEKDLPPIAEWHGRWLLAHS